MDSEDEYFLPPSVGARVWAMYQGARRTGKVLTANDKRGLLKIRFDDFPLSEFDAIFTYRSSDWSYLDPQPPSTLVVKTVKDDHEPLQTIAKKFKALIKVIVFANREKRGMICLVYVTTKLGIIT